MLLCIPNAYPGQRWAKTALRESPGRQENTCSTVSGAVPNVCHTLALHTLQML